MCYLSGISILDGVYVLFLLCARSADGVLETVMFRDAQRGRVYRF